MATNLGSAYIQVIPKTAGFQKSVDQGLNKEGATGKQVGESWGKKFAGALAKVGVTAAIGKTIKSALDARGTSEQLVGGVEKIFSGMDTSKIFADAQNAYKDLNISANDYLTKINDVGATFKATMGDEKAYETAKKGMQAIADYGSGTGKSVDVLMEKFSMITRATSSYQSIADQFSGILPATSADFLSQAQAAGFLSDSYKKLTDVPVAEYQQAVAAMLEKGTADLNLTGNTARESTETLTGSIAALKAAWNDFLAGTGDTDKLAETLLNAGTQISSTLGDILQQVIDKIPEFIDDAGDKLAEKFPELSLVFENLRAVIVGVTTAFIVFKGALAIAGLFETLKKATEGTTIAQALLNAVMAANPLLLSAALIAGVVAALVVLWNTNDEFREAVTATWEKLKTAVTDFANVVKEKFSQLKQDIVERWEDLKSNIDDAVSKLLDTGRQIVQNIQDGIREKWDALVSWFTGIWDSLFGNRTVSVGVSTSGGGGGYATGLNYVPQNNFPAMLHRGEAVLTKAEAEDWRSGAGNGGNRTVANLTITENVNMDGRTAARTLHKYILQEDDYHGMQLIKA